MNRAFPRSAPRASEGPASVLREIVDGAPGRALRGDLARSHPRRSAAEVDDAVQGACERLLRSDAEFPGPGKVYNWIRITAHRLLNEQDERDTREIAVDPVEGVLEHVVASDLGPAEAVLAREESDEMEALVREVADSLTQRRREILALYVGGLKRPQIAERLGLSVRAVEREIFKIMEKVRADLAERSGGGCEDGEPLVLRLAYGLASSAEAAQARLHLKSCHRCEGLYERLAEWREKAAAILPAPAIEAASPGAFERVGQRVADALGSAKQQVLGAGAQVRQQASAGYYRAVDPTPLAGVRPGAVAAVVASCITIGGGAAAYCANQGVDPIGAATGLIAGSEEDKAGPSPPNQPAEVQEPSVTPTYEQSPTPTYEPDEQTTEASQQESSSQDQPAEKKQEKPEPIHSEPTAQAEGEFEPIEEPASEPAYEAPPTEASTAAEPSSEPTPSPKPAPVQSSNGAGEFEP